jgi:hypothetical protein
VAVVAAEPAGGVEDVVDEVESGTRLSMVFASSSLVSTPPAVTSALA